jgi:cell division protein FtsQ
VTGAPAGENEVRAEDELRGQDELRGEGVARGEGIARGAQTARGAKAVRSRWRAAFFALAGLGIIAGVAWALLGSRLLVVRSVTVTGTHLVTPAQVLAAADVPLGTPLMRVDTARVAERVETIRQVASATVRKDWPDRLVITVRERVPVVAVRMAGGGYDLVDPSGVIVRWAAALPAALPLFLTSLPGSALRGDQGLAQTSAVLAELPPWLAGSVTEVAVTGTAASSAAEDVVTLYLRDNKTVVWGGTDRAAAKGRELAILMRDPVTYFDVSAPGSVVTK